jgi:hypothetical protein
MESDEMKDFNRVYDENGGGAFGFLMGVIESPTVLPSLFVVLWLLKLVRFSQKRLQRLLLLVLEQATVGGIGAAGTAASWRSSSPVVPAAVALAALRGGQAALQPQLWRQDLLSQSYLKKK